MPITLGGLNFFRGILKSCCNLVAAHSEYGRHVFLGTEFDDVRAFIANGEGTMEDFARWMVSPSPLSVPRIGSADHSIILTTRDSQVEGTVTFFGDVSFSVRLCQTFDGQAIRCGYIVDPYLVASPAEHRLNESDVSAIESDLPRFSEQSTVNNAVVQYAWHAALDRILGRYVERENEITIHQGADELRKQDF